MSAGPAGSALAPAHGDALDRAVRLLERPSFAIKVAELAGMPASRILALMPKTASRRLTRPLERAMLGCLKTAIESLDEPPDNLAGGRPPEAPSRWLPRIMAGLTGGVGGFFGAAALAIELPLTTTFMLRSIAEIARHHGEDLESLDSRLACLEVFALGDRHSGRRGDVSYYATRTVLAKLVSDAASTAVQRGTIDATAPAAMRLATEVATRFGMAVSDRAAASAIPVLGAIGGATVNVIFMDHFQQIAEGHFVIRRLERRYGHATVKAAYRKAAAAQGARR